MKIRLDLTKTNRFMVWEAGGLDTNRKMPICSSVIVAGPDGEKLKIAFDVNPRENITQCAFFAEIGQVLAACYVTYIPGLVNGPQRNVTLELARIEQLTTDMVQGEAKAVPVLQTLWVHRELIDVDKVLDVVNRYDASKDGHRDTYKNLLKVAVEKALTPLIDQHFFWAIPRVPTTQQ